MGMNDEWVNVIDDVPMIQAGMKRLSITVIMLFSNGNTEKGYYAHDTRVWYNDCGKKVKGDVIAWQSL